MELKATLKEYTAPEFQALVDKIWAVDLPKSEHDRLINHFDRIVGHPNGADLLYLRSLKNDGSGVSVQETNIRALERAQREALIAVNKFEFWKIRLEFAKSGTQRDLTSLSMTTTSPGWQASPCDIAPCMRQQKQS